MVGAKTYFRITILSIPSLGKQSLDTLPIAQVLNFGGMHTSPIECACMPMFCIHFRMFLLRSLLPSAHTSIHEGGGASRSVRKGWRLPSATASLNGFFHRWVRGGCPGRGFWAAQVSRWQGTPNKQNYKIWTLIFVSRPA